MCAVPGDCKHSDKALKFYGEAKSLRSAVYLYPQNSPTFAITAFLLLSLIHVAKKIIVLQVFIEGFSCCSPVFFLLR